MYCTTCGADSRDRAQFCTKCGAALGFHQNTADSIDRNIRDLKDSDSSVRAQAARELGDAGDSRSVASLIEALKDEVPYVRCAAANALASIGDAKAVSLLIELLRSDEWDVRLSAAEALAEVGDSRAIEPLTGSLKDETDVVRRAAAEAIARIKGRPWMSAVADKAKGDHQHGMTVGISGRMNRKPPLYGVPVVDWLLYRISINHFVNYVIQLRRGEADVGGLWNLFTPALLFFLTWFGGGLLVGGLTGAWIALGLGADGSVVGSVASAFSCICGIAGLLLGCVLTVWTYRWHTRRD
jgi:hypothetical protein